MNIEFRDPPRSPRRGYDWDKIAEALRQRPNEWAFVGTHPHASLSTHIKIGRIKAFRGGEFDAVSRVVEDGFDIYAKYIGGAA